MLRGGGWYSFWDDIRSVNRTGVSPVDVSIGIGFRCAASSSPTYSISGRVVDNQSQPLAGVTVSAGASGSATTNAAGYFTVTGVTTGTYTLMPIKPTYYFTPPSRTVNYPSSNSGVDFVAWQCIAPSGLDVCRLQPGDILLQRADSTYLSVFALGGTYFSHAALFLGLASAPGGDPNDIRPRIAEAQRWCNCPDRVNEVWETWLSSTLFWSGERLLDWAVVRPATSNATKEAAIAIARAKAAEVGVVFEMSVSKWDNQAYYCSKFVWRSYLDVPGGPNLEKDRGISSSYFATYWVSPDDVFFSSPVMDEKTPGTSETILRFLTTLWSPAHITLVDPSGRRTGYDPTTGGTINEIPGAVYFTLPDAQVETVSADGVGEGWQVIVTGYDVGEYTLDSSYVDLQTMSDVKTGTTEPGQIDIYNIEGPRYGLYLPLVKR